MDPLSLTPADGSKKKLIFEGKKKHILGAFKINLTITKIRACSHERTELLPVQFMSKRLFNKAGCNKNEFTYVSLQILQILSNFLFYISFPFEVRAININPESYSGF
jgi:hypothetical protein